jgi:hypothetical protein
MPPGWGFDLGHTAQEASVPVTRDRFGNPVAGQAAPEGESHPKMAEEMRKRMEICVAGSAFKAPPARIWFALFVHQSRAPWSGSANKIPPLSEA